MKPETLIVGFAVVGGAIFLYMATHKKHDSSPLAYQGGTQSVPAPTPPTTPRGAGQFDLGGMVNSVISNINPQDALTAIEDFLN